MQIVHVLYITNRCSNFAYHHFHRETLIRHLIAVFHFDIVNAEIFGVEWLLLLYIYKTYTARFIL